MSYLPWTMAWVLTTQFLQQEHFRQRRDNNHNSNNAKFYVTKFLFKKTFNKELFILIKSNVTTW